MRAKIGESNGSPRGHHSITGTSGTSSGRTMPWTRATAAPRASIVICSQQTCGRPGPGIWQWVKTSSAGTAYHTASYIRRAHRLPAYAPAGSFEAEVRKINGQLHVFARYVGHERGESK